MCIGFIHAIVQVGNTDYRDYLHNILGYFCILKGGEPGSTVFVTRYYGFPILNTTHMNPPSLLLYDAMGGDQDNQIL